MKKELHKWGAPSRNIYTCQKCNTKMKGYQPGGAGSCVRGGTRDFWYEEAKALYCALKDCADKFTDPVALDALKAHNIAVDAINGIAPVEQLSDDIDQHNQDQVQDSSSQ